MALPRLSKPITMVTLDSSANNIPIAYSEAAGSKVLTGLSGVSHLQVYNASATPIFIAVTAGEGTSTNAVDNLVCLATSAILIDNIDISTRVYIRSTGSAISSGKVYIGGY